MSEPGLAVSVVIPAYKRPELLRQAVLSVLAQDFASARFEVIVVDSSPDESNLRMLQQLKGHAHAPLHVVRKAPEGPGPSRVLGAERARGAVIAFMDSDCRATPDWLTEGFAAFADGIGIVQGRTLPDPEQPLGVLCRYVQIEAENPRYEGANIFFRRESLADTGAPKCDMTPHDERPTGGEDALLAWQVKRRGWKSTFAADALVYHEVMKISLWRWFYEKRMFMLPWLAREIPEMRGEFFLGVFLDRAHASLALLLVGCALSPASALWLLLSVPYFLVRTSEATRSLRGAKRLARPLVYLPRDLLAFALLAVGSVRHRRLLL